MAQYAYTRFEPDYIKLLDSVRELSVDEVSFDFKVVPSESPNDRMIRAFKEVIGSGFIGKTELINAARLASKCSKKHIEDIYKLYVGSDPTKHIWDFTVGDRGTHKYFLHPHSTVLDPKPTVQDDFVDVDQDENLEEVTDE